MGGVKILVVYDSLTGNVESMAEAVAEGCMEAGASVDLRKVDDVDIDSIPAYDGFAFGSPTHCGTMSVKMNEFFNSRMHSKYWGRLGPKWPWRSRPRGGWAAGMRWLCCRSSL